MAGKTRKQMVQEIFDAFKLKQGIDKAKWVVGQLKNDRKAAVERIHMNLITNDGIRTTI